MNAANQQGDKTLKRTILKTSNPTAAVMTLCALAFAPQALAQDKQATPGFNHKIPDKIMTPNKMQTRIGTLEFFDGMPSKATVDKVYDNLDLSPRLC